MARERPVIDSKHDRDAKQLADYTALKNRTFDMLNSRRDEFKKTLHPSMTVDGLISGAIAAIIRNPDNMNCTPASLIASIAYAGQIGLSLDPVLGQAFLSPTKIHPGSAYEYLECQFIPGYKGYIDLSYRSGKVAKIDARYVMEWDQFEYEFGTNGFLRHKKDGLMNPGEPFKTPVDDKITHFYTTIELLTGSTMFEVMNVAEVRLARDESPQYKHATEVSKTIWFNHFRAMGMKTVLHKILKFAPMSSDIQRLVGIEDISPAGQLLPVPPGMDDVKASRTEEEMKIAKVKSEARRQASTKRGKDKSDAVLSAARKKLGTDGKA
jgi:recombination protein RecT